MQQSAVRHVGIKALEQLGVGPICQRRLHESQHVVLHLLVHGGPQGQQPQGPGRHLARDVSTTVTGGANCVQQRRQHTVPGRRRNKLDVKVLSLVVKIKTPPWFILF